MPTRSSRDLLMGSRLHYGDYVETEGPTIDGIAAQLYRQRIDTQKEQKFATSFQKSQDYLNSLREEVSECLFRNSIDDNSTPLYVFEELNGLHHSPEHPLISKGLLGSTKAEQIRGHRLPKEKVWPSNVPRPQSSSKSFYRPNSTHNYLTKTITLGGSHDGFNPKHGTPTRAQLLRNRVKFTAAPDLTYSYLAQKRADGKREAVHRKNKIEEEFLQLKSSKVEMDKTAGLYRKYMIGSKYNTAKWIESHVNIVHDLVAMRTRPASSITPSLSSNKVNVKRRASSAIANNQHLRLARPQSSRPPSAASKGEKEKQVPSIPPRAKSAPISSKLGISTRAGSAVTTRTANLIPYTTPINSPGLFSQLESSITIKSVHDVKAEQDEKILTNRLDVAKRLNNKITSAPTPATPRGEPIGMLPTTKLFDEIQYGQKKSIHSSKASSTIFLTNPEVSAIDTSTLVHAIPANSHVSSHNVDDIQMVSDANEQSSAAIPMKSKPSLSVEIKTAARPSHDASDQPLDTLEPVTRTHSVSVELPAMDNISDTLSLSLEVPVTQTGGDSQTYNSDSKVEEKDKHIEVETSHGDNAVHTKSESVTATPEDDSERKGQKMKNEVANEKLGASEGADISIVVSAPASGGEINETSREILDNGQKDFSSSLADIGEMNSEATSANVDEKNGGAPS